MDTASGSAGRSARDASCASCPQAHESAHVGAGARACALRGVTIDAPAWSRCANHPAHALRRDRLPIGPVLCGSDATSQIVAHESPDTDAIRRHLVDLVASVHVQRAADLTFREASAIWQLERFGDRRAVVHLDRIRAACRTRAGSGSTWLELLTGAGGMDKLFEEASRAGTPGGEAAPDSSSRRGGIHPLERFTLRGRLLIMATVLVTALMMLLEIELAIDRSAFGLHLSWWHLSGLAGLVGSGLLVVGIRVFRWMGIPFLRSEVASGSADGHR